MRKTEPKTRQVTSVTRKGEEQDAQHKARPSIASSFPMLAVWTQQKCMQYTTV